MSKYQGWSNRDTWLVTLWLGNDRNNYSKAKRNKKILLKLKKPQFISALKRFHYGDKVNWNNVRVTEVKQYIREM